MSKHDFTKEEFADRLQRTRAAIAAASLDWLLVIHPVSMRWLIGQDNKSYTAFQCLAVSAKPGKLVIFTREMERNEFELDTMVDEVRGYNGREPEDPMQAFSTFADDLGLKKARVGHGGAVLVSQPAPVRSREGNPGRGSGRGAIEPRAQPEAREIAARDRVSPQIGGHRRGCAEGPHRNGRGRTHGAGAGSCRLSRHSQGRQRDPGQHHEPDDRRAELLRSRCADRAQASEGRYGTGRAWRRLSPLHLDAGPAMGVGQADRAPARPPQNRARGVGCLHGGNA